VALFFLVPSRCDQRPPATYGDIERLSICLLALCVLRKVISGILPPYSKLAFNESFRSKYYTRQWLESPCQGSIYQPHCVCVICCCLSYVMLIRRLTLFATRTRYCAVGSYLNPSRSKLRSLIDGTRSRLLAMHGESCTRILLTVIFDTKIPSNFTNGLACKLEN
jgi:hypothetical protein